MNCEECHFDWKNFISRDKLEKPKGNKLKHCAFFDDDPVECPVSESHSINGDNHQSILKRYIEKIENEKILRLRRIAS